ncbi:hypothetical protein [Ramlibacter agri]|nr:hypothetical protein [Ramlibacter agri]
MRKLMQWATSRGDWQRSDFLALPTVDAQDDAMLQRWQVVVGGLALLLSRESPSGRSARFPHTMRLYQGLRQRLRQGRYVDASPELIGDVMHETASVADPLTTRCLRACFQASLGRDPDSALPSQFDARNTSRLQSQPTWEDTRRD